MTKKLDLFELSFENNAHNKNEPAVINENVIKFNAHSSGSAVISCPFKKSDKVTLKIKLNGKKAGNFFLGVVPEDQKNNWFWMDKGNQLGFFYSHHYSHQFETVGSQILDMYEDGMIFILEAHIESNKLLIYDSEKLSMNESKYTFENYSSWRIAIGAWNVEIEVEILESQLQSD